MITIRHLKKEYPGVTPLKDVNVEISRSDVISVIGPSGTGKSTLIRCLNLLEQPTSGEIIIDGELITDKSCDVSRVRRKMGMVFQQFNLFPHMTVIENIMTAPVDLLGKSRQDAYDKGMEPEIILFDEPTSALDPTMVGEVQSVIRDLARQGNTMIIVTHEMKFAREVCNRVFYMDEGGIYEDGTPEQIFENPRKEKTRQFIRRLKVMEYDIHSRDFDFIGFNTHLEEFGRKHQISQKTIYNMQSYLEEMCMQLILPELDDRFDMTVTVEYSDTEDAAAIIIRYSGSRFDPLASANELPLILARKAAAEISYRFTEKPPFTNEVSAKIR
ncbi:MAG TPA: amino acid ABC transporter ATP-binding protein [Candidatus Eisenbergiella pullistercoris]|uniref:Amino acid ABC transporter ATP-binding protein n=1 Tax=Candidatus Eisenbergiella pullistercoris TaxID=2838555 RepID=A0A9D1YQP3_9FIRM|nr:amino acid ABC transporter ATP-binding protein [Candidatus Eisenbergiella pullistercoris]